MGMVRVILILCLGLLGQVWAGSQMVTAGSRPLQIVASGGIVPFNQGISVGGNFACRDSITRFRTPNTPVIEMRVAVPGFFVAAANSTSESSVSGSFPIAMSVIWPNVAGGPSTTVPVKWGQVPSTTIPSGTAMVLSDPIYPSDISASTFLQNTNFWIVAQDRAPAGFGYLSGRQVSTSLNEQSYYNNCLATSNLAITAPSLTNVNASFSAAGVVAPISAIIGRSGTPMPSALIFGDSIADGTGDVLGWGANGFSFMGRGLTNAGIAWFKQTTSNMTVSGTVVNGYAKRDDYWRFASGSFINLSGNDVLLIALSTAGYDLTTTQSGLTQIWSAQAAQGLQVMHTTPGVYTDSADSWMTQVGQTSYAIYNTPRDTIESYILGRASPVAGNYPYGAIKIRNTWATSPSGNTWATATPALTANFCAFDQIHPITNCHISGSVPIQTSATLMVPE